MRDLTALRRVLAMILPASLVVLGIGLVVQHTANSLAAHQIRSGFAFLGSEAGFDLGVSVLRFDASNSYARAFAAGMLNSLTVFVTASLLATVAGVSIGLGLVSPSAGLRRLCGIYVELARNLPVALQLLIWYAMLTELPPAVDQATQLWSGVFLSKGGLQVPWPLWDAGWGLLAALLMALAASAVLALRNAASRRRFVVGGLVVAAMLALACMNWWKGWVSVPAPHGLSVSGGLALSPEFLALAVGLGVYAASYVAEIVRAGVSAVPAGQWEACITLGLGRSHALRHVIMPQAWRIAIPPLASQYLNLAKNSSLGVLVGYPDLVAVANTAINQTGQAIECIAIIMVVFLILNLAIATLMQRINRRLQFQVRL
ncbi:amino acid ABC transporter permease [Pseudoduganella sp. UC29_106]|uniref:amino acid ABC transporter permease n=1 Tax=Pseudoduganella sp. UC29_106 TaxID=3374553 RepID=UPI003756CED9